LVSKLPLLQHYPFYHSSSYQIKGCTPPISPKNEVSKTFFEVSIFPYNFLRFPYPPNKLLKLTSDSSYGWKNYVNMIG